MATVVRQRRPRVLIDALAYHPDDGGFATAVRDLLRSCAALTDMEFAVAHHPAARDELAPFGLPMVAVRFPRQLKFYASIAVMPALVRTLRPAALHCEISALPAGTGVPGSVTVHDLHFLMDPDAGGRSPAQRALTAYWRRVFVPSLRRAAAVKAVSATSARDATRLVQAGLPVEVIYPRVEASPAATPAPAPAPGDVLRLLTVGAVVPRRNLPFLLRALQGVRRPWTLDVVGQLWWGMDHPDVGAARADPRVTFHGHVARAELERLYRESHLLISASSYEGFGYPVAEAFARGLPVLSSDVAAFREFVPDECRFSLDSPVSLTEAIDAVDAVRHERWRAEAASVAGRFSAERHVGAHADLFGRLVARGAAT